MIKIKYDTTEELWKIENELKAKGFKKTADCYWAQIFNREKEEIHLQRN